MPSPPQQLSARRRQGCQGLRQGLGQGLVLAGVVTAVVLILQGPGVNAISLDSRLSSIALETRCPPLPEPEDCIYGLTRDHCGRLICAKGPGERCGGSFNGLGRCGEGMHCKCNRCVGCSTMTFTCDPGLNACL
ncbi:hypothetical protein ONE63_006442 [Megalurothrips usitatus]|uniref:Neuroparsin-A-like n=1 Tax=Megalurothrips usitatus TaxID=439358 RepID=A0AAV7XTE1_9NEOP|nr:hypothetical protein ONE63_006442 [Megalurothrips usitatus]